MAGGPRDDHAVMAVVALTLLVALFVLAVSHETYVFYYPAIVAGAALMWNRNLALLAGVTTTAFGSLCSAPRESPLRRTLLLS